MRFRAFLLAFVSLCLGASPSFAAICEVNCSFRGNDSSQPADHSGAIPTASSAAAKAGGNHACCAGRNTHSAFVLHHTAASQDCAAIPSLRLPPPAAVKTQVEFAGGQAVRNSAGEVAAFDSAETPPLIEPAPSHPLPSIPLPSSILRI